MGKNLFFATLVAIVLAGCVKTEVDDLTTQKEMTKIVFDSPLLYSNFETKAEVHGEIGSYVYPGSTNAYSYPREEEFIIYAVKHEGNLVNWDSATETLFNGDVLGYDTDTDSWAPKTDDGKYYYWPENAKLSISAVSPADMEQAGADFALDYAGEGLTIDNFVVSSLPENQIDVLFSRRTSNKTQADMLHSADYYSGVSISFQHALASIHFSVKKDAIAEDVVLTKIELKNAKNKGSFAENITEGTDGSTYVINDNVNPEWTVDPSSKDSYVAFSGKISFPTEAKYVSVVAASDVDEEGEDEYSHPLLLLPQTLADDVELVITYKIGNADGKTKTVKLNQYPKTSPLTHWNWGTKYTYRLYYSATSEIQDRIFFSPSTEGWIDAGIVEIPL